MDDADNIFVYLDDGRVFSYRVYNGIQAREHAHAIAQTGYRHAEDELFEHYPAHRILKIKYKGDGVETKYYDNVSGT